MEKFTNVVIFITAATNVEVREIADVLLSHTRTACVNIVHPHDYY